MNMVKQLVQQLRQAWSEADRLEADFRAALNLAVYPIHNIHFATIVNITETGDGLVVCGDSYVPAYDSNESRHMGTGVYKIPYADIEASYHRLYDTPHEGPKC